ncbi:multidrug efflux MFS transporter [Lentilactobacillus parafarraginis]|nr:MFS transporter [Lentilactobacillus parafarraginis]TLQ20754.1 multidrug efflux MFS transporter [Lentilactobacillus parafarraginis]
MVESQTSIQKQNAKHPFFVIVVISLMTFMGVLTETSMNVTFPTLMKQFNVSLTTVQWVTTGYLLTVALLMLTSAYLKRRFTNKQLFIAAACLFMLGDILGGMATTYWVLLLGRLVQAGCVGLTGPLMINIIMDTVPATKFGTYMGMANLIILVAPALGPTFGGTVDYFASWRMIFWITLPITALLLILGIFTIKQYSPTRHYVFDWLRFALLAVSLTSLIMGLNVMGDAHGLLNSLWYFAFTVITFGLFMWRSKFSKKALFNLAVFKHPSFIYSFLPYILLQASNIGINFVLPNYVQVVDHASAFIGGLVLLPGSVLNGLGQPIYGWMLDRYGGKLPLYLGNTLFFITALGFTIYGRHLSIIGIILLYTVFAMGRSMAFGNCMTYGLKVLSGDVRNDANAVYSTGQQVAGSIGTTVMAVLMSSITVPHFSNAQNVAVGSQMAFGIILFVGTINFWLFTKLFKAKP